MDGYQAKAIKLYLNFFLKDKVTDFENRIIKAKSSAISYVQKEIELTGFLKSLMPWSGGGKKLTHEIKKIGTKLK